MTNIGIDFKLARSNSSVSLEEASNDTGIPLPALEQIEEGSIGSFKDIFVLRKYLQIYAKYLGLDGEQVIDDFNEYMFEYTSRIPIDDLTQALEEKQKEENSMEETGEIKVVSPYLNPKKENKTAQMVITIIVIIILIALALIWAIKQVMIR